MLEEEREGYITEALVGDEARKFLESDLGKIILGMAMQEVQEAQLALESVNPTDVLAVERLQNKAKLGRYFESWLTELITRGEQALKVMEHDEKS